MTSPRLWAAGDKAPFKFGDMVRVPGGAVAVVLRPENDGFHIVFEHGHIAWHFHGNLTAVPLPESTAEGAKAAAVPSNSARQPGGDSGAIEAARGAVCQTALSVMGAIDWNIAISGIIDSEAIWAFHSAVKAYRALLAPPSPPDATGELVEAAELASILLGEAAAGATIVGDAKRAHKLEEAGVNLRAAISRAKEGRT